MSNNLNTYDENGDRCVMLFGVNIAKNLVTDDDTMNESFSLENFNHRPDEYENENQEFDTGQSSNHEHIKKGMFLNNILCFVVVCSSWLVAFCLVVCFVFLGGFLRCFVFFFALCQP